MAKEDLLKDYMKLEKGSVTPLGVLNDEALKVQIILDKKIMEQDKIFVHPLTCEASVAITPKQLISWFNASGREPYFYDFESNNRC